MGCVFVCLDCGGAADPEPQGGSPEAAQQPER